MKKKAIIVAAGNGSRMGSEIPKQFLPIGGKPLLYYTIRAFIRAFDDIEIILVLPPAHITKGIEIIDGFFNARKFVVVEGGSSRFESVQHGLSNIDEECIVFVHDGVRCLVSPVLLQRCYEVALANGTAVAAIQSKDSVRLVNDEGNEATVRESVRLIQTPQVFHSKILVPAYQIPFKESFTDEATVVEAYGIKIQLVEGEENNIKVTTPNDLILAEKLLSDQIPD